MLSEVGMAAREAGLASLRDVVQRRGRRRVMARALAGGAALTLVVAVMVVWFGGTSRQPNSGGPIAERGSTNGGEGSSVENGSLTGREVPRIATGAAPADGERRIAGVGVVRTDPLVMSAAVLTEGGVVAELAPRVRSSVDRLDDDGLQRALRAAGEPAGIVRIGRRVMTEGELGQAGM